MVYMTLDEYDQLSGGEKRQPRTSTRQQIEFQDQCKVFEILKNPIIEKMHPEVKLIFATLNGVHLSKAQAGKAKAAGNRKGVSDIVGLISRRGYHGFCIEQKTLDGKLSKEQEEFGDAAEKEGWYYAVSRSAERTIEIIEWYLEIKLGESDADKQRIK